MNADVFHNFLHVALGQRPAVGDKSDGRAASVQNAGLGGPTSTLWLSSGEGRPGAWRWDSRLEVGAKVRHPGAAGHPFNALAGHWPLPSRQPGCEPHFPPEGIPSVGVERPEQPSSTQVTSSELSARKPQAGGSVSRSGQATSQRRPSPGPQGWFPLHPTPLLPSVARCSPLGPQHGATAPQPASHIMPAHFLHLQGGGMASGGQALLR